MSWASGLGIFPFSFPGPSAEGKSFQLTFLPLFCTYLRCHKRKLSFPHTLQKTREQFFTCSERCSRPDNPFQHMSLCCLEFSVYFSGVGFFFTLLASSCAPFPHLPSPTSLSVQFILQLSVEFIKITVFTSCMPTYFYNPPRPPVITKIIHHIGKWCKCVLEFPSI